MAVKITRFDIEKYASITVNDPEWEDTKYVWNAKKDEWKVYANDGDGWYASDTATTQEVVDFLNDSDRSTSTIKYGKVR